MTEKYKDKYRIESIRLKHWDYSSNGYYFITICTKNWEHYFGKIVDGRMQLSKIGEIAEQELLKTEKIRENVKLDACIIMPNHIHGIIVILGAGLALPDNKGAASSDPTLGDITMAFKSISGINEPKRA